MACDRRMPVPFFGVGHSTLSPILQDLTLKVLDQIEPLTTRTTRMLCLQVVVSLRFLHLLEEARYQSNCCPTLVPVIIFQRFQAIPIQRAELLPIKLVFILSRKKTHFLTCLLHFCRTIPLPLCLILPCRTTLLTLLVLSVLLVLSPREVPCSLSLSLSLSSNPNPNPNCNLIPEKPLPST